MHAKLLENTCGKSDRAAQPLALLPRYATPSIMHNDGMSLISVILSAIVLAWLDNY